MSNPSSSPMMQSSLVNPLAESTGASPFSTMKRDVTVSSLLDSPHLVPTLCASESHVLTQDALMCRDSSVSHLQYGLPARSNSCNNFSQPPSDLIWHIYEEPSTTTMSTAPNSNPEYQELNHWNLGLDLLIEDDPKKDEPLSLPESCYLLESRPSTSYVTTHAKMHGPLLSDSPDHGPPCWVSLCLRGTYWYLQPSSSFTVHPDLS